MADFDWRNHIKIAPLPFEERDGRPGLDLPKSARDYYSGARTLVEKTLDQMSQTPEFRELLLRSSEHGPMRLLASDNQERLSDPRLELRLTNGLASIYLPQDHSITIATEAFPFLEFGQRPYPITLQNLLHHEIGHGADPIFDHPDKTEVEFRQDSFERSLAATFQKYPNIAEDYRDTGRLAGSDLAPIRNARNHQEFESALYNFQGESAAALPMDGIDRNIELFGPQLSEGAKAKIYLISFFREDLGTSRTADVEFPIIKQTNEFMEKYYGEPPRIDHSARHNKGAEKIFLGETVDYADLSERLKTRIHSDFKPDVKIEYSPLNKIEGVGVDLSTVSEAPIPRHPFAPKHPGLQ